VISSVWLTNPAVHGALVWCSARYSSRSPRAELREIDPADVATIISRPVGVAKSDAARDDSAHSTAQRDQLTTEFPAHLRDEVLEADEP
jgi:hypothetical protein